MKFHWLQRLKTRPASRRKSRRHPTGLVCAAIERLEDRMLLSAASAPATAQTQEQNFQWNEVTNARYYHVEVYDVARGQLIGEHGVTSRSLSLQLPQGEHRVYVRAIFAGGGASAWQVAQAGQPAGYRGVDEIFWDRVDNASEYHVLMYNQATGSEVRNGQTIDTSFAIGKLDAAGPYEIYVRPVALDGTPGEWGSVSTFTATLSTSSTGLQTLRVDPGKLTTPAVNPDPLASPLIAVREVELNLPSGEAVFRLEWLDTGADEYQIVGYDMSAGRQVVDTTTSGADPQIIVADGFGEFPAQRRYQFFVRSVAADGRTSAWSNPVEYWHEPAHLLTVGLAETDPDLLPDPFTPTLDLI